MKKKTGDQSSKHSQHADTTSRGGQNTHSDHSILDPLTHIESLLICADFQSLQVRLSGVRHLSAAAGTTKTKSRVADDDLTLEDFAIAAQEGTDTKELAAKKRRNKKVKTTVARPHACLHYPVV